MAKIYIIGDNNYDITFKDGIPISGNPGGSMYNVAMSLGVLGCEPYMIGDSSGDNIGQQSIKQLNASGVNTDYITISDNYQSKIALAFLDGDNNAEYSFYKPHKSVKLRFPDVSKNDIVIFGSSYALRSDIRKDLISFLKKSKRTGALIVYDPNFRESPDKTELVNMVKENIKYTDIFKTSDEDIKNIFGDISIYELKIICHKLGCKTILRTANKYGVDLITSDISKHIDVPKIVPVSTIGAGDTFNAGIVFKLFNNNKDLNEYFWLNAINFGIKISQIICKSNINHLHPKHTNSLF